MPSERYNAIKRKLASQNIPPATRKVETSAVHVESGRSERLEKIKEKINSGKFVTSFDENDMNAFLRDSQTYMQQSLEEYNALNWKTATSKEAQNSRKTAAEDMYARTTKARSYLNANKRNIDPEQYKVYSQYLDDFSDFRFEISERFEKDYRDFSQFDSEDAYNQAVTNGKYIAKYAEKNKNQMQAAIASLPDGEEKDWLIAYEKEALRNAEDYDYEIARAKGELARMERALPLFQQLVQSEGFKELEGLTEMQGYAITQYRKSYGDPYTLKQKIKQKKEYIDNLEKGKKYNLLDREADFSQYSQYDDGGWMQGYVNDPEWAKGWDHAFQTAKCTPMPLVGTLARIQDKFGYQNIHLMDDLERARFNYIENKNGERAAKEYLDFLQPTLNARSKVNVSKWVSERTKDNWAAPIYTSLLSTPLKFMSGEGMLDVVDQKIRKTITGDVTPVDYNRDGMMFATAGNAIRSSVAQQITDATGGAIHLDEKEHPYLAPLFNGKSWGDIYQLGMSMNDSAVVVIATALHPIAGKVASSLLSASAATDATLMAAANGASDEQAITVGLAAGFFEWFFEKYEIESLMKQGENVTTAALKQGFNEAVGEGATELCNTVVNAYVLAENSDWQKNINTYLEAHPEWTKEQATKQAWMDAIGQVLSAMAGGAVSGGIMGAGSSTIQNIAANLNAKNIYGSDPAALVAEALELDPNNSYAKKLQDKLSKNKKLSGSELRKLVEQNESILNRQGGATDNAAGRLSGPGETGDFAVTSDTVAKQASDQRFTSIPQSEHAQTVVDDLKKQQNATLNTAVPQPVKTQQPNTANIAPTPDVEDTTSNARYETSTESQATRKSTGETVKIREIASIKNGKLTFRTEDGSEVAAFDVHYGTEAEAMVYEAVAQLEGIIDSRTATRLSNRLIHQINEGDAISDQYIKAVAEAYRFGYEGRGIESTSAKTSIASELTDRQRNYAYKMGEKYAMESKTTRQDGGTKTTDTGTKTAEDRKKTAKRSKSPDGKSYDNVQFEGKVKHWGEKQRADVEYLNFVARDIAGGVTVHVFESFKGADGNRYYYDSNGKRQKAPNGKYIQANGDIYLDLNAGDGGEGLVLNTFVHELYHHIEQWSPAKARQLAEFLVKEQGMDSVGAMVEDQIKKAEAAGHGVKDFMKQGMSRTAAENTVKARAFSDFVADSLETVFTKGDALGTLQRLKKSDQGLFDKIKAFVDKWVSKLKKYYQGNRTISIEGQTTSQLETFEQIQELFMEALVDAGENYRNADTVAAEKNTADGGTGVAYSVRANFYKEFDAWDKKDTHVSFVTGTTSDVLKSIGMKDQNIVLRSGTVLKKLKDHPEMTFDIFKGIPELLEHPVIVQFSDAIDPNTKRPKYDSSITVLGELYADVREEGKTVKKPVLVALELLPTKNKGTTVLDFAIIKSAYSKNALQQYLNENSILYIDPNKKRTDSWLSLTRLRLPFGENRYGSIRKIAYADGKVKVQNAKNMTGMQKALFDAGVVDEFGNQNFSDRNATPTSNRSLLANALETAVQSDEERQKLQDYRAKIDQIEADEQKLLDLKKQLYEMSFAKGPRDAEYREKMSRLQKEAASTERRLNKNEKEVLNLEATKPLQDLLQREKDAVKRRMEKKHRQSLRTQKEEAAKEQAALKAEYATQREKAVESRKRTEMRNQISRDVKNIYKLYNRGKDANNVKEEMKEFVFQALSSAELLLDDLYTDDDMIRNGMGIKLSPKANALLQRAKTILYRLDKLADPAESTPAKSMEEYNREEKRLKLELSEIKTEMQMEFRRERWEQKGSIVSMVMQDLCDAYKELANSTKPYIRNAYHPFVQMHLEGVRERLKATRVEDMTLDELTEIHEAYTMVLTSIRDANKAFCANRSIDYIAKQLISEFSGQRLSKSKIKNLARNVSDYVGWNYEKLYYALERIGSATFTQLFVNLANAENIIMEDIAEAKAYQWRLVNDYGYNKWSVNKKVDREFVDNLGHSFQLTLGEIMLLYAYTRRGNVWKQLEIGGFVLEKKALTDDRNVTAYKLTQAQCLSITNTLTAEQKHFVEGMQKYLSDVMGAKGNEVSMKLYGVKLYNDPNYCPVHVAGQYQARVEEATAKKQAGFESLAHTGFTKTKNIDAKATIVMESFMDIWVDHVNEMSRYHGAVPALEDIRRVMNYSDYSNGEADSVAVKAMMENRYGKQAVNYFDDLYREVNSGAVLDKLQSLPKKALSKTRKLAVAYSLSVLVQQPSSISRAFAMVDPKYFAGLSGAGASAWGVAKTVTNRWSQKQTAAYAEMVKYAPGVTLAKEIGGFDASGGGIRNYLMDTEKSLVMSMKTGTAGEKLQAVEKVIDDNPIANLPNLADKIAWIEIWNACKREVKDKHRSMDVKSEEYMKLVGKRFTEVIRATQVYDSVFAKSPWLKSKNVAVQYMVSFMNEPNVVANMAESTIRDIRDGDFKKAAKKLGAVTRSIIFCNVLKSLIYAMRDDDEDETYIEKYMQALIGNVISDFTGFNYIPLVRDIWSVCRGYDVERPDMSIFSDLILSIQKYYKVKNKDTSEMSPEELEEWNRQCTDVEWGLIGAIAGCFGIPIKNIYREIDSVFNCVRIRSENVGKTTRKTFWDACYQGVVDALPWHDQESKSDKLYEALTEGNTKYLERLQAGYLDSDGKLKPSYYTALRKGLREHDPRIQAAAHARKSMDTDEYLSIIDEIVAEGHFSEKDVVAAIRSEYNHLKDD